jgi:hypothetical protein
MMTQLRMWIEQSIHRWGEKRLETNGPTAVGHAWFNTFHNTPSFGEEYSARYVAADIRERIEEHAEVGASGRVNGGQLERIMSASAPGMVVCVAERAKGNRGMWFSPGSNKRPVACPHNRSTGIGYGEAARRCTPRTFEACTLQESNQHSSVQTSRRTP